MDFFHFHFCSIDFKTSNVTICRFSLKKKRHRSFFLQYNNLTYVSYVNTNDVITNLHRLQRERLALHCRL